MATPLAATALRPYAAETSNSLALQAARRIAQEESFGSPALVRELNMAEILSRAKEKADELIAEKDAASETAKRAAHQEAELALNRVYSAAQAELANAMIAKNDAVELAAAEARKELALEISEANRRKAHKWAQTVVWSLKIGSGVAFAAVCVADFLLKESASICFHVLEIILGVVTAASFFHFIGFSVGERLFGKLELWLTGKILLLLQARE